MPSMNVEILPLAQQDVDQALVYIAADDPDAAHRLLERIMKKLREVAEQPYSGEECAVGRRIYRKLYVRPYVLYYRIIHEHILVMRVLHEKMGSSRFLGG